MRNIFKIWIILSDKIISHRLMLFSKIWWIRPLFKHKLSQDNPKPIQQLNQELTELPMEAKLLIPQCKDIQICKIIIRIKIPKVTRKRTSIISSSHKKHSRAQELCKTLWFISKQEALLIASHTKTFNAEMEANQELIQQVLLQEHLAVGVFIHLEAQSDLTHTRHHQAVWSDQELKAEFHQPSLF